MSGLLVVFAISWLTAGTSAAQCGGVLTSIRGTITSPNYPKLYPNSKICTWYINPPTGFGDIVITFTDFKLEENNECKYDNVMIYKGNTTSTTTAVRKLCGTNLPDSYSSRSTHVAVRFKADASNVFKGFKAEYTSSIVYETPRCSNLSLTADNATLQTTCTVRHSSAMDQCVFKLKTGNQIGLAVVEVRGKAHSDITYVRHKVTGNQCTLKFPLSELEPANYTVRVEMLPGRKAGTTPNTLKLTRPSVRLTSCPASQANTANVKDGLIKQGTAARCSCELTDPGFPRGSFMWQATRAVAGFMVQNLTETTKLLTFAGLKSYKCVAKTILDAEPQSVEYTPEYAYGPDNAQLSTTALLPICLEGIESKTIEITCSVNENSSNPPPLFTIKDEQNNTLMDRTSGTSDKPFEVKLNLSLSSLGENNVKCKAENRLFGEFQAETELRINVQEVPVNKPTITIKSIQHGHVILAGDDVTVACAARGWPAEVVNVTLNCWGHSRVTHFGNTAFLLLHTVTEEDNGQQCICKAAGTTSCYRGTSEAAMHVAGPRPVIESTSRPTTTQVYTSEKGLSTENGLSTESRYYTEGLSTESGNYTEGLSTETDLSTDSGPASKIDLTTSTGQSTEPGHSTETSQPTVNDQSSDEDKKASASKAMNDGSNSISWRDGTSVAALCLAFIVLVVIIIAALVVIRRHRRRESSKSERFVRLSEVQTSCREREAAQEHQPEHRPQPPPPEEPRGNFYTTDLHLAAGAGPQQQQQRASFADDNPYELVGNTKGGGACCAADGGDDDHDDYMNVELDQKA